MRMLPFFNVNWNLSKPEYLIKLVCIPIAFTFDNRFWLDISCCAFKHISVDDY